MEGGRTHGDDLVVEAQPFEPVFGRLFLAAGDERENDAAHDETTKKPQTRHHNPPPGSVTLTGAHKGRPYGDVGEQC